MFIKSNESEENIRKEIGLRIKQYRVSSNMTQTELAQKSNTSMSTVVRVENGEDSKFSNYIKILSGLNLAENFNVLIPEAQPNFKVLYEEDTTQKRARKRASSNVKGKKTNWIWNEDKEKQQ